MNIHIELVKKWLADNDSVTQQELEDNRVASNAAYAAAATAATAANAADVTYAEYWVKLYEELPEQGE